MDDMDKSLTMVDLENEIWGAGEERLLRDIEAVVGCGALAKSMIDPFDYAMRLRTGEMIRYVAAEIRAGGWIHLASARWDDGKGGESAIFPRGIDVRLSEIVWVKDAPYGS